MKSLRRVTTAAVVTALLAIGGAGAAQATISYPSGGVWSYGVGTYVYSNYYHGYRWHGSTAVGTRTYRSPLVRPGRWSIASAPAAWSGNKAYYRLG